MSFGLRNCFSDNESFVLGTNFLKRTHSWMKYRCFLFCGAFIWWNIKISKTMHGIEYTSKPAAYYVAGHWWICASLIETNQHILILHVYSIQVRIWKYSRMSLLYSTSSYDNEYNNVLTSVKQDFELAKYTPNFVHKSELWDVDHKYLAKIGCVITTLHYLTKVVVQHSNVATSNTGSQDGVWNCFSIS